MDKCGLCMKSAVQLFETGKEGVFACFKCQPLVPEVTLGDVPSEDHTVEIEVSIDNYQCNLCDKVFEKNLQLQNHLRNHRAERRFICTYCDKAFSQSNNLRAHLRIHTNERPYKCSECGKAFTQVTNLNNHVRLHTGERPFICTEPGCNKAYAQVTNLNQHRKRHINGRPLEVSYDCTICGEQFDQRNHMYIHRREVHSELKQPVRSGGGGVVRVQHTCKICEEPFNTEKLLLKHISEHMTSETQMKPIYKCVFEDCGSTFDTPAEHTEHLLRAHQLRELTNPSDINYIPPRRGRPPKIQRKMAKVDDDMQLQEVAFVDVEVKQVKAESQFLPKLKIHNLFQ